MTAADRAAEATILVTTAALWARILWARGTIVPPVRVGEGPDRGKTEHKSEETRR